MIGIYKIENLLNHKVYIGQSIHIERRWKEHCNKKNNSLIGQAIQKYGKENFSFQVLCECLIEDLPTLEEYYISFYNSIVPNGYNIMNSYNGHFTSYCFYSEETLKEIIKDIKEDVPFQEIAEKYNLSLRNIYYINNGDIHYLPNENYPIKNFVKKEKNFCLDCGKEITYRAIRCVECDHKNQRKTIRPERELLKKLIREKSFCEIGKNYNVSDNAIRKWCKKYNLPFKKSDINNMTEEQWQLV